jgi:2-dehydropantoate 2-reductase
MRYVVYGAGAIGGVVGGRLAQHGAEVVLIARGAHAEAIRRHGLRIESPAGATVVAVPVVESPAAIDWRADDAVLVAVKSQHTAEVLIELRRQVVDPIVVCLQNGVENERVAQRLFARVYAVCVMCPAGHLEPGVVEAYSRNAPGILDIGRYPHDCDAIAEAIAADFRKATFASMACRDVMRWKYAKLLMNLANIVTAAVADGPRTGEMVESMRREGRACLAAAGIDVASVEEDADRRGNLLEVGTIAGRPRSGNSSWQSLERRSGSVETDFLNGEIVLLGRLHGVSTPVNAALARLAFTLAESATGPAALDADEILRPI